MAELFTKVCNYSEAKVKVQIHNDEYIYITLLNINHIT